MLQVWIRCVYDRLKTTLFSFWHFEGVVVAVHGEEVEGGDFKVYDILEPGYAPLRPLPGSLYCF